MRSQGSLPLILLSRLRASDVIGGERVLVSSAMDTCIPPCRASDVYAQVFNNNTEFVKENELHDGGAIPAVHQSRRE